MNIWLLAAIIAVLVVAGIAVTYTTAQQEKTTEKISCSGCGNACTAEKNCGLATCGAVNGRSCGCGKE